MLEWAIGGCFEVFRYARIMLIRYSAPAVLDMKVPELIATGAALDSALMHSQGD